MRAIYILSFFLIIILNGCTTIEVAKEFTKATNSVKKTIQNIANTTEEEKANVDIIEEKVDIDIIEEKVDIDIEKEKIVIEKKKKEVVVIKQKKITSIKFLGKNLNQLINEFGEPSLIRKDGNTKTVRFDTSSCRLFVYSDLNDDKSKVEYYEIRDTIGNLLGRKENIKKCFREIQKNNS